MSLDPAQSGSSLHWVRPFLMMSLEKLYGQQVREWKGVMMGFKKTYDQQVGKWKVVISKRS